MNSTRSTWRILGAVLPALLFTGCAVDVREEQGDRTQVDVRTPVGTMRVNTNLDAPATGLAVYPGARPLQDGDEPRSADVSIGAPFFGVHVVAARFESDDAPNQVADFYRTALGAYGAVTECRGDIDFEGRSGSRPVCRERRRSKVLQLVAGTERRHHLVSVEPRRGGSEFAVVFIQARGEG
jgi:hypothetical protein